MAKEIAGFITGNNAADLITRLARELAVADGDNIPVTLELFDQGGRKKFINVWVGNRLASTIHIVKEEESDEG